MMAETNDVILDPTPCDAAFSFDDAIVRIARGVVPLGSEVVRLDQGHGRILAEPICARVDSPRVDVAAMDGYAVNEDDVGTLAALPVTGVALPGSAPSRLLRQGRAIRIFTGAPIPRGADRVIVQELADLRNDEVLFAANPGGKRHVRERGSDFSIGDVLLPANRALDPRALLVAAAADGSRVRVWRRPRVYIIATGDEIMWPGLAALTDVDIPDSLSNAVMALAEIWGAERTGAAIVPDRVDLIEAHARNALQCADIIIVTGGASVGERDFSRAVFIALGLKMNFAGVAIKPGKPVWHGQIGATHVLGLPGNPTAALVTARLFLAPLLCLLTGRPVANALSWRQSALGAAIAAGGDRESFLSATYEGLSVIPREQQNASSQHNLATTNALIRRLPYAPAGAIGDPVMLLDF
jgi:molybdopterin molybdotransferase